MWLEVHFEFKSISETYRLEGIKGILSHTDLPNNWQRKKWGELERFVLQEPLPLPAEDEGSLIGSYLQILIRAYEELQGTLLQIEKRIQQMLNRKFYRCATGRGAKFWPRFEKENQIAIGFGEHGDFGEYSTPEEIYSKFEKGYMSNNAGAINTFTFDMNIGDVVFATQGKNTLHDIGIIKSGLKHDNQKHKEYSNYRDVEWFGVSKTDLQELAHEIGYTHFFRWDTLSRVKPHDVLIDYLMKQYPDLKSKFIKYGLVPNPATIKAFKEPVVNDKKENRNCSNPLNQILYGPPGTGKTYRTAQIAVEICGEHHPDDDRDQTLKKYRALVKEGRVDFTTFHQSMTYEDFVEGIKPRIGGSDVESDDLQFEIKPGIFKQMVSSGFNQAYNLLVEQVLEEEDELVLHSKRGHEQLVIDANDEYLSMRHASSDDQQGAPSDKVYKEKLRILDETFPDIGETTNILKTFAKVIGTHVDDTLYWAALKRIQELKAETGNHEKVLIIDEINRGNIAAIFGELITLLEPDKRLGEVRGVESHVALLARSLWRAQ